MEQLAQALECLFLGASCFLDWIHRLLVCGGATMQLHHLLVVRAHPFEVGALPASCASRRCPRPVRTQQSQEDELGQGLTRRKSPLFNRRAQEPRFGVVGKIRAVAAPGACLCSGLRAREMSCNLSQAFVVEKFPLASSLASEAKIVRQLEQLREANRHAARRCVKGDPVRSCAAPRLRLVFLSLTNLLGSRAKRMLFRSRTHSALRSSSWFRVISTMRTWRAVVIYGFLLCGQRPIT